MLELRDGTRKSDKQFSYSLEFASNQPTRWLVLCWSTFGARISHGRFWTHKTRHGLDSGEATTFPHIVYFVTLHRGYIQMVFFPGLPKGSLETDRVGILATLWGYNFMLRPPIGTRSKAKLYLSLRAFQRCVARHLHARKLSRFPTFRGRESNCQFDS